MLFLRYRVRVEAVHYCEPQLRLTAFRGWPLRRAASCRAGAANVLYCVPGGPASEHGGEQYVQRLARSFFEKTCANALLLSINTNRVIMIKSCFAEWLTM